MSPYMPDMFNRIEYKRQILTIYTNFDPFTDTRWDAITSYT